MIRFLVGSVRGGFDFLYDFLVGDAWELFVGPIAAVVVAGLLSGAGLSSGATRVVLFVIIVAVGAVHLTLALQGAE